MAIASYVDKRIWHKSLSRQFRFSHVANSKTWPSNEYTPGTAIIHQLHVIVKDVNPNIGNGRSTRCKLRRLANVDITEARVTDVMTFRDTEQVLECTMLNNGAKFVSAIYTVREIWDFRCMRVSSIFVSIYFTWAPLSLLHRTGKGFAYSWNLREVDQERWSTQSTAAKMAWIELG